MYQNKTFFCKTCGKKVVLTAIDQQVNERLGISNDSQICERCQIRSNNVTCARCGRKIQPPGIFNGPVYCSDCYVYIRSNQ